MSWKELALEQAALNEQLRQRITEQDAIIAELEAKIAVLKKNSRTSSKPPSSDIVKPPKPGKKGRKRRPGAQKGHPRHLRKSFEVDQIDHIIEYTLDSCPKCNGALTTTDKPRIHQQVELVDRAFIITEYRQLKYRCEHCQKNRIAPLPDGMEKPDLFGPNLTAYVAYLKGHCSLSFSKIRSHFSDVFSITVSTGFLTKLIQKASEALEQPYEELKERLPKEDHLHVDETGGKENGELRWTWCFRAALFTLFHIDPSRGSIVLLKLLGEDFDGHLSCDFFGAYQKFSRLSHAVLLLCWAHLIREVKFLAEHKDKKVSRYGQRLLSEIEAMFSTIHRRGEILDRNWYRRMYQHRESILKRARCWVPANKVALNLSVRLRDHWMEYFRFIETGLPPTNNLAEQSIRRVVLNRKVTQGTRSDWGNRWWERIWSVLATCEQQGKNVMTFLRSCMNAAIKGIAPPKILDG